MLRDFRKASKPEEQFIEDIRDGTIQVKMIKPVPGLGHYPWGLRRANFPQQKEMPEVEMFAKAETAPPHNQGWCTNKEATTTTTATLLNLGSSDEEASKYSRRKQAQTSYSLVALHRCEQIQPGPLSSAYVE